MRLLFGSFVFRLSILLSVLFLASSSVYGSELVQTWADEYLVEVPRKGKLKNKRAKRRDYLLINIAELLSGELGFGKKKAKRALRKLNGTQAKHDCQTIRRVLREMGVVIGLCDPNVQVNIASISSDSRSGELWGMEKIRADKAWTEHRDTINANDRVTVAILDTGVDYNHPDLIDNMWVNSGEIPGNGIDDDGNGYVDDVYGYDFGDKDPDPMDRHGHGTHVAGTVGATGDNSIGVVGAAGPNSNIDLMAVKFLGDGGGGSIADAVAAIIYAVKNGARVINASWGGYASLNVLEQAIEDAADEGVLFVAAAGNDGVNTDQLAHFPSTYNQPNVVSVAASDEDDNLTGFSNYGIRSVDIAAPGQGILSTFPGGRYARLNGTSMAAPHVSAAAALLLAKEPSLNVRELRSRVIAGGVKRSSYNGIIASSRRLDISFLLSDNQDSDEPVIMTVKGPRRSQLKKRETIKVEAADSNSYSLQLNLLDGQYSCELATGQGTQEFSLRLNLPKALQGLSKIEFSSISFSGEESIENAKVSLKGSSRANASTGRKRGRTKQLSAMNTVRAQNLIQKACDRMSRSLRMN